ncbi:MAG: resuscitation-promoting factor RpfA [Acidimicrobiaceae bacterium]
MALQGTLDTFALPDVLRLLASTKKTGRLLITGDRGSGSVWVDAGAVVGSEATGSIPDAGAVDVLFELLRYGDGSFTFEAGTTAPEPAGARAVEPLLKDAERQLSEWHEIEAVVPSMDAWVSLVAELEGDDILITADRWRTIVAIGSGTSVTGIAHTLRLGELDACRYVKELVELGVVKVRATPMPAPKPAEAFASLDGFAEPETPADDEAVAGSGATWDPFSIEIPGVDSLVPIAAEPDTEPAPEFAAVDVVSVVEAGESDEELPDADDVAQQLASLSPKAAQAVAAAAKAATVEERDAALDEMDDDDEPVNRGLLLKFLSSVKS